MKKLLICALLSIVTGLTSCSPSSDGHNHAKVRSAIIEEMKTTNVTPVPGEKWKFIVYTSNNEVWYVEALSAKAEITSKTLLFSKNLNGEVQ